MQTALWLLYDQGSFFFFFGRDVGDVRVVDNLSVHVRFVTFYCFNLLDFTDIKIIMTIFYCFFANRR